MAPFFDQSTTVNYWPWGTTLTAHHWTTAANVVYHARSPRLRLPPPTPTVRRGARPPRPRRPHTAPRVEAVRRGRAEARPSRALRQRRRRARA